MKILVLILSIFIASTAHAEKLICFGDSVTEGYGVAEADKWCTRLRGINAGIGGNHTGHAIARFSSDVLRRNPDVVTIGFGIGDAVAGIPVATYRQNLTYMVRSLKRRGVRVLLLSPNVTMRFWLNTLMQDYIRVVRDVARREQVTLVDDYQSFAETLTTGVNYNELLMDEVHPNAFGANIIYQGVREKL